MQAHRQQWSCQQEADPEGKDELRQAQPQPGDQLADGRKHGAVGNRNGRVAVEIRGSARVAAAA